MPFATKEQKAAHNKMYYEKNKEKHLAKMIDYAKTYYQENKEEILAKKKERREQRKSQSLSP